MNKKKKTILRVSCIVLAIILVLGVVVYFSPGVFADVGNNNRYDNGGGSGSSDDSDIFGLIIWLLFQVLGPIPALILAIVVIVVYIRMKKSGKLQQITNDLQRDLQSSINMNANNSYQNEDSVVAQIQAIDPNFSKDEFLGWVRDVFFKIQEAWTKRDWSVIRPFESNELFELHNGELQEYINNHKINVVEKINVKNASLREFREDGDKEVVVVELYAIMRDYVIDDKTRKVLESNPNKDWHMRYLLTFYRKKGVKTKAGTSNKSTTNCPNCGAPTEITSAGKCEYCDSVITTGEHDWVLSDIHSIN